MFLSEAHRRAHINGKPFGPSAKRRRDGNIFDGSFRGIPLYACNQRVNFVCTFLEAVQRVERLKLVVVR
jgi:hypothetical protein